MAKKMCAKSHYFLFNVTGITSSIKHKDGAHNLLNDPLNYHCHTKPELHFVSIRNSMLLVRFSIYAAVIKRHVQSNQSFRL